MMRLNLITKLTLILFLFPLLAASESPEEKGLAIARGADERDKGFGDSTVNVQMILRNKQGQESVRELRLRSLEVEGDSDKGLTIFDTPKDVKGTAFLNFTHKSGDDDQWLYLPALERVKRISSRNKAGSFMGSEFAYEDFASQEVEKYTYKWIRDEVLDGQDCFVVEFYPVDEKNSGYTRQMTWIDKAEYRVLKVDFYDRKDALFKTLTASGFEQYLEQYWRAHQMDMVNHQTGKSARLLMDGYAFRNGLTNRDFDRNSLARAR